MCIAIGPSENGNAIAICCDLSSTQKDVHCALHTGYTGPSENGDVTEIIATTLPGSRTQAWSSRGKRCRYIACNFYGEKNNQIIVSSKQMDSPEQREKELEQPTDGVDPVQGLDALPELGGRVPRGAESLAEVGGGDEGDQ